MKTTILVGAGATLAEALPSQPPRDRRPPLDATFFELCRLAKLDGRSSIQRYMKKHYGLDPFTPGHRMEEVFNYIYSDAFAQPPTDDALATYWSLLQMYRTAIARTTNPLPGTSRFGIGALLRFLWRHDSSREFTFVTFNQDLVIEKALHSAIKTNRYASVPWNIEEAYGMAFSETLVNTTRPRPFDSNGLFSIPVLKLHGSLNWVYTVRSGTDPRNSIRNPSGGLRLLNQPDVPVGRINTGPHAGRRRRNDLLSLVVPPIYEKASRYQAALQPVWDRARQALESADELVIFGYSFPDSDFSARSMLRQSYHKNPNLKEVQIIDLDPGIASRIAAFLGASSVYYCRTVPDFISHYD